MICSRLHKNDKIMRKTILSKTGLILSCLIIVIACSKEYTVDREAALGFTGTSSGTGESNAHQWVDLGLSVKWATFNIGASNIEDIGDSYAWGETAAKKSFNWSNYKWCNGSDKTQKKYNNNSQYGTVDNITVLEADDDAAHVKWGGEWQIPTKAQWEELHSNCKWNWAILNGVKGYKVTSKVQGYTDRFIFIPANDYWSSTLDSSNPSNAYAFNVGSSSSKIGNSTRSNGMAVRPVCPSDEWSKNITLEMDHKTVSIGLAGNINLTVTAIKNIGNQRVDDLISIKWSSSNPAVATVDDKGVVKGLSAGTATITASYQSQTVTSTVSVIAPQYVDLGLSVKWASFNMGASRPEEYGDYYAWGETEIKDQYTSANYKFNNKNIEYGYTKYNFYKDYGPVDYKYRLDMEDDMARVAWGSEWRMPTIEEMYELVEYCTWNWTTENQVFGYRVTGPNGNSIFLPAGGYRNDEGSIENGSTSYLSSSLSSEYYGEAALGIDFCEDDYYLAYEARKYGELIRPVSSTTTPENILKIDKYDFNKTEITLNVGSRHKLSLTYDIGLFFSINSEFSFADNYGSHPITLTTDGFITANEVGSCVVEASIGYCTAGCTITVSEPIYEDKYVDLGLSVNWATCNVGALSPESFGYYYAWGETEPKNDYSWSTYKYCRGSEYDLTKYCNNSIRGYEDYIDNKKILEQEDDVAQIKLGGNWHIPTIAEYEELIKSCTWEHATLNGVRGYKITSNKPGYTDKSIFLPYSGYIYNTNYIYDATIQSNSSLSPADPAYVSIYYPDYSIGMHRCEGVTVRPVCASETWAQGLSITLNKSSITLNSGINNTLFASVTNYGGDVCDLIQLRWSSNDPTIAEVDENGVVKGLSVGTATITASYLNISSTCVVTVVSQHEYVDLGLSVNWATCNIGAENPEDYGDYYAWGETKTKMTYSYSTYKYGKYGADGYYYTKYCNKITEGYNGYCDNKLILDPNDDVAHVIWGGDWRIPTPDEWRELYYNCSWEWTKHNDVYGYKVTSKKDGYTTKSIFLPAAGEIDGSSLINEDSGCYWLNTLEDYWCGRAELILFDYNRISSGATGPRLTGRSIRPVCP